jgi:hypothetical protein
MASPDVYYGPGGFQGLRGAPAVAKIAPAAKGAALAKRLWSETKRLTAVMFNPA